MAAQKLEKETIEKEIKELIHIREEMFSYFDKHLPKNKITSAYDFSSNPTLNAKEIYEHCFKLDYQARKLRAFLVQSYGLNP